MITRLTVKPVCIIRRAQVTVVSGNGKLEKNVLGPGSGAYIVNNEKVLTVDRAAIRDHTYVRQIARQHPGNQISWLVVIRVLGFWQGGTVPFEKHLQVGDSSVIDIGIRPRKAPILRIFGEAG